MYLDSIALTRTLPCLAAPGKIVVIGKPNRLLGEVLPYLATLPGITPALEPQAVWCGASVAYNPDAHTLTFRRPAGFMTLYIDRVYITQVRNTDEGLGLLAALKDAITPRGIIGSSWWPSRSRAARHDRWMCGRCCRRRIAGSAAKQPVWPLPWACCNTNAA
jgi:ArsR family metal-binding transcriptional regulator